MKIEDALCLLKGKGYSTQRHDFLKHSGKPLCLCVQDGDDVIVDNEGYFYGKVTPRGEIEIMYQTEGHPSRILTQLPRVLSLRKTLDENDVPYRETPERHTSAHSIRRTVLRFLEEQLENLNEDKDDK